ncbi:MAG: PBP1A family penicillin-binding protein [Candidatus Binatia bacterium]
MFPFLLLLSAVIGWQFYRELEQQVVDRFSSHNWDLPSKIYAEPLLLYPGMQVKEEDLLQRFRRLDYRPARRAIQLRGEYNYDQQRGQLQITLRDSPLPRFQEKTQRVAMWLQDSRIVRIVDLDDGLSLPFIELDPEVITGVYDDEREERRIVKLYDVPSLLVKALLAAEDHRFFEHEGIDLWRILGAIRANLLARRPVQGGSTLTQQLVKNFFLTQEKVFSRKLVEICIATIVEFHYSKLEILENYLNEIYLGQHGSKGIFGMWEAARVYFGKEPRDLTLGEIAVLAGMVKSPNTYSPLRHVDRVIHRRNYVLQRMRTLGDISEEEYQAALQEKLVPRTLPPENNRAPYFTDFVTKELAEQFSSEALATAGLRVFTSLNVQLQEVAQEVVETGLKNLEAKYARLQRAKPEERIQACLIAIQPQTGEIRAMVGGRDYRISQFNRAINAHRQPGSVFKPVVFLAALAEERRQKEGRFLPTSIIKDTPFSWSFSGQTWRPGNYNNKYFGDVSLRQALEQSLNAATARLAHDIGLAPILRTAQELGFTSSLPEYPSLVLGSGEVSPYEVAVAFSTLANNGLRVVPRAITLITNREGEVLSRHGIEMEQTIPEEEAYLITHMLEGVLDRGTARAARQHGFSRPAAGKTGTTNDYGDAWFVGYTPELVTVVWVGFDQRQSLGLSGSQAALPIWVEFMKRATAGRPVARFSQPLGVTQVAIDPQSGFRATDHCPVVVEEAFFRGEEPQRLCPQHAAGLRSIDSLSDHPERDDDGRMERETAPPPRPAEKSRPWWRIF